MMILLIVMSPSNCNNPPPPYLYVVYQFGLGEGGAKCNLYSWLQLHNEKKQPMILLIVMSPRVRRRHKLLVCPSPQIFFGIRNPCMI